MIWLDVLNNCASLIMKAQELNLYVLLYLLSFLSCSSLSLLKRCTSNSNENRLVSLIRI